MTSTPARPRIVGTLRNDGAGKGTVRMEDLYDTDAADLWSALTDPSRLARWIADVSGEFRVGGRFQARFTSSWDGPGRIDVCEEPSHLALTLDPGQPDETVIEATLTPEDGMTRLVIEERGLPVDVLADHGAGWQTHVEDLAVHLRGEQAGDWRTRWTDLLPIYRELGVEQP